MKQTGTNTTHQMNLKDTYRTFIPTAPECASFLSTHGTFSRMDQIPGHKISLNKFEKIEVFTYIFMTTMEYNQKSITKGRWKNTNRWKLSNTHLTTIESKKKSKENLENISTHTQIQTKSI